MKARGMGRVYQRGTRWWIQYSYRGRVYRETCHKECGENATQKDAVKLLRRRLGEIAEGRFVADADKVTFEQLAELILGNYRLNGKKSLRRVEEIVRLHLRPAFGEDKANEISHGRINRYMEQRQKDGAAASTIRYEVRILGRMFKLAVEGELLAKRPKLPTIQVDNVRTGFFDEDQVARLLGFLSPELRPLTEFAYLSGWRRGEILSLSWRQVDFQAGIVRLEPGTTKNKRGRILPLDDPQLEGLLRSQRRHTDEVQHATGQIIPWVFHRQGEPIGDFHRAWDKACKDAGVPGRVFHDFRRTRARDLIRAGVNEKAIMKLCGWETRAVFDRYSITTEADLREAMRRAAKPSGTIVAQSAPPRAQVVGAPTDYVADPSGA